MYGYHNCILFYIFPEKKHISCFLQMAKEDKISEKQILLVYAHHLFEPLLPDAELFIDKYIGVDATECPYCKEKKEKIQSGSTSFGKNEDFENLEFQKFVNMNDPLNFQQNYYWKLSLCQVHTSSLLKYMHFN